jgi:hypothetical protein
LDECEGQAQIAHEERDKGDGLLGEGWIAGESKACVPAGIPGIEPTSRPVVGEEDVDVGIIGG